LNSFGIMTLNVDSESAYLDEIASRTHAFDMECYRFLPSNINPLTLDVHGTRYDSKLQEWVKCDFPIPPLIYDRCFYGDDEHSKLCKPIVSWLKTREDITFLGYGLPNKLDLFHILKDSPLSPYLPPSQSINGISHILNELNSKKRLIIKPINGSQGYGIYYLKKNDKNYHVKTEKNRKIISRIFPNEAKLTQWLLPLIRQRSYLLQPYLELTNVELRPFDIRILLQKNEHGNWIERGKGVRSGNSGGILSNLNAGGTVTDFDSWSSALSKTQKEYISAELDFITKNLPPCLEKELLPLFELGIDIGVAKNGALWILDVNSKPGRKVLLKTQPDLKEVLYLAPLLYGKYLSKIGSIERKRSHENTLYH
jgi:glutathione synthase/RimK-type ligase-like ATP-grasp enzyme